MRSLGLRIAGLALLVLLRISSAAAGSPPVGDMAVLADRAGTETIASVSAPAAASRFEPVSEALNAGYTRDAHWLRFTLQAPTAGEWWLEVQPSMLDDIRLFEPAGDTFRERRGGDWLPFSAREVPYRAFVFKLALPDEKPRTFYLRVKTTGTSLVFVHLWQPDEFLAAANVESTALGVSYGVVAIVLLFNLIVWFWLRDALYGWFCLHLGVFVLFNVGVNGVASQYLFPDSPRIGDAWLGLALFASVSASAPFYRRMLRIDRSMPVLHFFFRLIVVVPLLLMPSVLTGYYTEAARVLIGAFLAMTFVGLWRSWRMWREGSHEGPLLLFANMLPMLGGMAASMTALGIYPGDLILLNGRQITALGTVVAMHFALAIRIRDMRAAQHEATTRAQIAETEATSEREAHAEQGRFIAMLSHELKTPLAVIDGAAQALARIDRSHDPEVARRHERIRRAVGRIDRLVEQFLVKDRLDTDGIVVQRAATDVAALLRKVVAMSDDGGERVRLTLPDTLAADADAALLGVAVANLIDNALKYSPPEAPIAVSAMARAEAGRAGVEIVVADAGPGIPPDLRQRVFSQYARGDDVGHVSGAGLGLYLVRRIAELHGGGVELSPRSGGAVFQLWLPERAA